MTLIDTGHAIDGLPVELTWKRVIEYFDGERLVELRSAGQDPYFKIWSDTDGNLTRWLILRLTDSDVAHFLHMDMSLRTVIEKARDGHVYVVDMRGTETHRVAFLRVSDIAEESLPSSDSFYDDTLTPECRKNTSQDQLILLDGHWNAEELAKYERRYTQVYAFNALFGADAGKSIQGIKDRLVRHVFTGSGWSYVSAFDKIVAYVPRDDKPQFKAIQLASPGVVRYGVDGDLACRVRDTVACFRELGDGLITKYNALHDLLLDIGRTAREEEWSEERLAEVSSAPNPVVWEAAMPLAEALGLDPTRVWSVAGSDLNASEVIASYFRKAHDLYKDELRGVAVIV